MRYLEVYTIMLTVTLMHIILFYIFMCKYQRTLGAKIWGISAVICAIGILISFVGYTNSKIIESIGGCIYYLGEVLFVFAIFEMLGEKTTKIVSINILKKRFVQSTIIVILVAFIMQPKMYYLVGYLGVWYIVLTFIFLKYYTKDKAHKSIVIISQLAHIIMLIDFNTYDKKDYRYLILGLFYIMICILLAMSTSLIYYQRKRMRAKEKFRFIDEIMQNTPMILNRVDCEGNILYSNKGFKTLLEYEEDWQHIDELVPYIHEIDKNRIQQIKDSLKVGREGAKTQFQVKHKKGHYIWVSIDITAVVDDKGVKKGNILCWKNITSEKYMYVDLVRNQRKFYQLFHGIQDAIFIVPFCEDYVHSKFNESNKAAYINFGYYEHEYKKMCLADLDVRFLEDKVTRGGKSQEDILEQLLKMGKSVYETEYCTKTGKKVPVEVADYRFVLDKKPMIMSVVRDISERNFIKEAKKLEKVKSDFFANVAHELRTPLNVVIMTMQSFEIYIKDLINGCQKDGDKDINFYTDIMKQNILRLLKLVNNFLYMAKIDSGFYEPNLQNYNIVTLVEDISQSVIPYIEENGISFEFDTDIEEKVVACDIAMMERIILNIISNAVKFTPIGGIILVNITDKGKEVEIRITDSGVGIPTDKQNIIFERFKQADQTFTRKQEGCGIGLSLVKFFVKQNGGRISVESEENLGSTFIITFPAFEGIDVPYNEHDFNEENNTLYRHALEFSDIINRKVE